MEVKAFGGWRLAFSFSRESVMKTTHRLILLGLIAIPAVSLRAQCVPVDEADGDERCIIDETGAMTIRGSEYTILVGSSGSDNLVASEGVDIILGDASQVHVAEVDAATITAAVFLEAVADGMDAGKISLREGILILNGEFYHWSSVNNMANLLTAWEDRAVSPAERAVETDAAESDDRIIEESDAEPSSDSLLFADDNQLNAADADAPVAIFCDSDGGVVLRSDDGAATTLSAVDLKSGDPIINRSIIVRPAARGVILMVRSASGFYRFTFDPAVCVAQ
jgi:hypothetical protein